MNQPLTKYDISLLSKLQEYDQVTYLHSQRVSLLMVQYAAITGRDMTLYANAGLFHDVGKLNIPKEIICSDKALTTKERFTVDYHSTYSYQLLYDMSDPIKQAVLYHHTPAYISRLQYTLRMVDIYDALRSDRPYSKAMPLQDVMPLLLSLCDKTKVSKRLVDVLLNNSLYGGV